MREETGIADAGQLVARGGLACSSGAAVQRSAFAFADEKLRVGVAGCSWAASVARQIERGAAGGGQGRDGVRRMYVWLHCSVLGRRSSSGGRGHAGMEAWACYAQCASGERQRERERAECGVQSRVQSAECRVQRATMRGEEGQWLCMAMDDDGLLLDVRCALCAGWSGVDRRRPLNAVARRCSAARLVLNGGRAQAAWTAHGDAGYAGLSRPGTWGGIRGWVWAWVWAWAAAWAFAPSPCRRRFASQHQRPSSDPAPRPCPALPWAFPSWPDADT